MNNILLPCTVAEMPTEPLLGQHVLYEVNDEASRVNILAVVGQRQNPRFIL